MIDATLRRAFQNTRFIVFAPEGEITLRVGQKNQEADNLLASFNATVGAFVTACNPGAIMMSDAENAARQCALVAEVQERGHPFLYGRGVAEQGDWPPEDSILIIGIDRTDALGVADLFGQAAVVFAQRERPVELLWCQE